MLKSQLEIIEQGQLYLNSVSKEDYSAIITPNFISSAGSHMRHIIDHYLALMSGLDNKLIDYDKRMRGSHVELSPTLAIDKLNEIADWIKNLNEAQLNKLVTLKTEVSVTSHNVQTVQTSIARELVFAGSHAVHHYAMIVQISFAQTKALPQTFGLAPATATYMRENTQLSEATDKADLQ
ncbi:hypothetical protein CXF85_04470 [Colwellia sp. 75C3]|uniref:hypothetical protein n=1 Tax=Colwellia sp. 75C3 TaxID=888425 RepID=UPI000C3462C2|nr:hypothetical protein [Colwellia sp. 75C3]PKG86031.1 hypothetical protein CXF85_04470 [Colwellia sp. 75C3]